MKVLLVGNYEHDGSMSMKVWANALSRELVLRGIEVERIAPRPLLGRLKPSAQGVGKWLGYLDRYILFPAVLWRAARKADVVHICDHSYAMYTALTGKTPTVVTCHDLLAVRGAMGEQTDCPASSFGKLLQRAIVRGLEGADKVACVSAYTYRDAQRLLHRTNHLEVVLNGLNYPFQPLDAEEIDRRLSGFEGLQQPFVLHIGSNLARKNRESVLRVVAQLSGRKNLRVVFAGVPLNAELLALAAQLGIEDRVVQVARPDVQVLEALYNRAALLMFPSRFEGFGWPPIEAQACGCPVVASNIPPAVEVLAGTAASFRPDDVPAMAGEAARLLDDAAYRAERRVQGFENVQMRFTLPRMIEAYIALYGEMR
jgi:glycosyltransferase involved in cell wall biosynthesis